jgi:hypothetical protein
MKCSIAALLLTLVLADRPAVATTADDETNMVARQTSLLPSPCEEFFGRATRFQSPIGAQNGEVDRDGADSLYDKYYSGGLEQQPSEGDSKDGATAQASSDDEDEITAAPDRELTDEPTIGSRLAGGLQLGISWLATSGETALGFASKWWEQGVTFLPAQNPSSEEVAGGSNGVAEDRAEANEDAPQTEAEQSALVEPPHHEWTERLYVTPSQNGIDMASLASPGRLNIEHSLGIGPKSAVFADFYWAEGDVSTGMPLISDIAMPWRSVFEEVKQDTTGKASTPATPSLARRMADWAEASLGDWTVAFRNISRQIARLDWTLLLKDGVGDRAVRNTVGASNPIER